MVACRFAPFHDFETQVPKELRQDLNKLTEDIKKGRLVIESPNARSNLVAGCRRRSFNAAIGVAARKLAAGLIVAKANLIVIKTS